MWFGNNHRNYNFEILVLNAFKEKNIRFTLRLSHIQNLILKVYNLQKHLDICMYVCIIFLRHFNPSINQPINQLSNHYDNSIIVII